MKLCLWNELYVWEGHNFRLRIEVCNDLSADVLLKYLDLDENRPKKIHRRVDKVSDTALNLIKNLEFRHVAMKYYIEALPKLVLLPYSKRMEYLMDEIVIPLLKGDKRW